MTVVDQEPLVIERLEGQGVQTVCSEGASFLGKQMVLKNREDGIIPSIGLLYKTIEDLAHDEICSVVMQSRPWAPGLGEYQPEDLERGLAQVLQCHRRLVLFSTACFCHGVVNTFKLV